MPIGLGRRIEYYEAAWECDECGKAQLAYTGGDFTDDGIKTFEHECPECGELAYLNRIYPALAADPIRVYGEPFTVDLTKTNTKKKGRRRKRAKPKGK